MKELHMIVDCQYGSSGKGLLAGVLAETMKPDTIIIAWGPNSGHTYINHGGRKFVNTALPNGIVSPNLKRVLIGPGSVVNPLALWSEIKRYDDALPTGFELLIHENAAVVREQHRAAEQEYAFQIGSTMKGVGEAVIDKIRRRIDSTIIARDALVGTPLEGSVVSASIYNDAVDAAELAIIEGSQGFSLSINNGFYPFTTSRDCTTHQFLSDCAVPMPTRKRPWELRVIGVARTYPIRVANRFKDGKMVGWSGPCYNDQKEIEWGDLGMSPELTTVTQLPRRLFTWSHNQIADAVRMNGIDDIFLNFINYIPLDRRLDRMFDKDYKESIKRAGATIRWVGHGSTFNDVYNLRMGASYHA
jgi:adenylosuccinate synthase